MSHAPLGTLEFGTTIPMSLYRLYDTDGVLLYVGISGNLWQRLHYHATAKDWWGKVSRTTVEWIANREDGLIAEATAIQDERPVYNIHRTPPHALPEPHQFRPRWTRQDPRILRQIREQRLHLTRRQAVELIGCSLSTLRFLETGRLGASEIMLHRIADAYGVKPGQLLRKQGAAA